MKYKILEVHPFDAWYNDRNEIIGEVFDLQGVEEWGDDEIAGDGSSLKGFVMAFGYYAIKVEPQDLSALLARIAELKAALRPLANVGNAIDGSFYDTEKTYIWAQHDMENPIRLSIADAIRAARLLDGDK